MISVNSVNPKPKINERYFFEKMKGGKKTK